MDNTKPTEEISVNELASLISRIKNKLNQRILNAAVFIIRHFISLIILVGIGIGITYFEKEEAVFRKKTYTISTTEYGGDFLTYAMETIMSKVKWNDQELKKELGFDPNTDFAGISLKFSPNYSKRAMLEKEELQSLEFISDNKLVPKDKQIDMFSFANSSYDVTLYYPQHVDADRLMQAVLEYMRKDDYAKQLHTEILDDINYQIASNKQMLDGLGNYVESLSNRNLDPEANKSISLAPENDLGPMLFARIEVQRIHNKLIAEKVKIEENFRLLYATDSELYSSKKLGISKQVSYPLQLMLAYIILIYFFKLFRRAWFINKERKSNE